MKILGYVRAVKQRGDGIEAVHITWHSGDRTPKHNHHSRGRMWVLKGRIFEIRDGVKRYCNEGDEILEIPDGSTHIVGNDTDEVAITFHVYRPELEMDVFPDDEFDIAALELPAR